MSATLRLRPSCLGEIPALFTTMARFSHHWPHRRGRSRTACSSAMSSRMPCARRPRPANARALACTSGLASSMMTGWPSSARRVAIARSMPRAAPVTRAVRLAAVMDNSSQYGWAAQGPLWLNALP
ncbi:Uncharacterised protein [Bordetella pertussis]|nr:Uncharacterised protein [Bordetella pertussis]